MTLLFSFFLVFSIACYQTQTLLALTTSYRKSKVAIALITPERQIHHHHHRFLHALNAFPTLSTDEEDDGDEITSPLSLSTQQIKVPQQVSPVSNSPPPVPPKRMDPLMASMTRDNPASANLPTRSIPLFGEVPVDGSLMLLVPAVVFAILGFVFSAVIAIKAQDQIVDVFDLNKVVNTMAQSAINQPNQVYDKNVCRGICSTQQDDLEGMYQFMKSITQTNGK
mmetsp:Transcript_25596/g.28715  ORF Transcript_25596/g.28715 Transcript_25596/m.28715 type:complete len:224 (-) Transcript_25596:245-916(-)|eukprot:CAMPEP_0170788622 /NCGR_PEP_ID=MMETSP0733-20121128/19081_1 /TAXON_ID=186038 /ORGANISM="Fragilariopsis kerguelensis, Strain L26-C5" /LENGTH=223 /DNA_ID=CAMNT_0011135241 /DNA_START=65 /DNA_END=736 /DNA_ORIENTATION=+